MLQIKNLTLHYGERALFDGIGTVINPGERVGLVGPNGAGKSTLLRLIAGEIEPDRGEIHLGGGASVGYLPQDGVTPEGKRTVLEEVEQGFPEILSLEKEAAQLREELEKIDPGSDAAATLTAKLGVLQDRLEQHGAWRLRPEIERVLSGLGFSPDDFNRPVAEFSGGWLMRIALARLLLRRPTYLLLDEPTNHLDIESLQWMEQFLLSCEGAVVVVSHDRAFLDTITSRTLALDGGSLGDYAGNFSFYESKAAGERDQLRREFDNRQKQVRQTEAFIERFRYKASKAKQVQSRIKQLEKLERIELQDRQEEISFRFPQPERSGRIVMELKQAGKRYGNTPVFDRLDYRIERGEKVAVVGPNGAGKSTLIRMLAGVEPLSEGDRIPGHNVNVTWFAQHQAEELVSGRTILEELRTHAPHAGETEIRSILGCFLFSGEDVFKKISVLSGGEKSRVALARMLITPANFIILDEPTNHLDMQSKRILQHALEQYEGTCMIVSHDRSFVDPIVNRTLEVQPGYVKSWPGNVSDYLERRDARDAEGEVSGTDNEGENGTVRSRKEERRQRALRRELQSRKVAPLRKRLGELETQISDKEQRKQQIERDMSHTSFYEDSERVKTVSLEYETLKSELALHYNKWEELAGRIEFLEQEPE